MGSAQAIGIQPAGYRRPEKRTRKMSDEFLRKYGDRYARLLQASAAPPAPQTLDPETQALVDKKIAEERALRSLSTEQRQALDRAFGVGDPRQETIATLTSLTLGAEPATAPRPAPAAAAQWDRPGEKWADHDVWADGDRLPKSEADAMSVAMGLTESGGVIDTPEKLTLGATLPVSLGVR
jgi:hypothetical protein